MKRICRNAKSSAEGRVLVSCENPNTNSVVVVIHGTYLRGGPPRTKGLIGLSTSMHRTPRVRSTSCEAEVPYVTGEGPHGRRASDPQGLTDDSGGGYLRKEVSRTQALMRSEATGETHRKWLQSWPATQTTPHRKGPRRGAVAGKKKATRVKRPGDQLWPK